MKKYIIIHIYISATLNTPNSTETTTALPTEGTTTTDVSATTSSGTPGTVTPSIHTASSQSPTTPKPTVSTTKSPPSTPKPSRRFDGASFGGGIALGLGIAIILIVAYRCYNMRRNARYGGYSKTS